MTIIAVKDDNDLGNMLQPDPGQNLDVTLIGMENE
jgi:hypothetical protein